jgi:hypothetical protein
MNVENILNKYGVDLHMSPAGFEQASDELKKIDKKSPQVYVHVGSEGNIENQVLRIGSAVSGVYRRWMNSTNGHKNTFLWAIGESDKLTKENAEAYPLYLLFFAGLSELKTKLYVLTFQTREEAKTHEKKLMNYYGPIWEIYKYYPRMNKKYPFLSGQKKNREIVASVARLGGALEAIKEQRYGNNPFSQPIQDLISMDIRSHRTWHEGITMSFFKEPTHFIKTALSDLQGAWNILRDTVVESFGFPGSDKIIFHIDEAMSWECVRDLNRMYALINLIHNIANQNEAPEAVLEAIIEVRNDFEEVRIALSNGEIE